MTIFTNTRFQSLFFFILACLLYANTLGHGFVLDDQVILVENTFVQKGLNGIPSIFSSDAFSGFRHAENTELLLSGGRYRPLSIAFFAVLVQFFGNNSLVFHLFAVLLFAASCLLLYQTLRQALKPAKEQLPAALIAWGATVLFATHPVHTEVAANVKSCDEQLALLASLGILLALFRAFDSGKKSWYFVAGGLFLLACLAKETALSMLLIAPLALWIFRDLGDNKLKTLAQVGLPLVLTVGLYLLFRGMALDWQFAGTSMNDPLNNPFLKIGATDWEPFTFAEKSATIWYVLLDYARLLVWPHPLTHDYYPFKITRQSYAAPAVWASIALYTAILGLAAWGLLKKWPLAFGIILYLIPLLLVANVFVPVGTFMAERFLFMPSAGFCFFLAAVLVGLAGRFRLSNWIPIALMTMVAAFFALLTLQRNPAWASNKTLVETDITTSTKSAKLQNTYGTMLLDQALVSTDTARRKTLLLNAEKHLREAITLHASYYDAALAYGACTFYLGEYDRSIMAYRGAYRFNPEDGKSKTGLLYALHYGGQFYSVPGQDQDTTRALEYFNEAWTVQPDTAVATRLAQHYEQTKQYGKAAAWLEKALALAPGDTRLLQVLSDLYRAAGEPEKAKSVFNQQPSFLTVPPTSSGGK